MLSWQNGGRAWGLATLFDLGFSSLLPPQARFPWWAHWVVNWLFEALEEAKWRYVGFRNKINKWLNHSPAISSVSLPWGQLHSFARSLSAPCYQLLLRFWWVTKWLTWASVSALSPRQQAPAFVVEPEGWRGLSQPPWTPGGGQSPLLDPVLFCCSSSVFPARLEPGWWKECPLGKVTVRALLLRPRQVLWRNPRLVPGRRQDFWLEI